MLTTLSEQILQLLLNELSRSYYVIWIANAYPN